MTVNQELKSKVDFQCRVIDSLERSKLTAVQADGSEHQSRVRTLLQRYEQLGLTDDGRRLLDDLDGLLGDFTTGQLSSLELYAKIRDLRR